MKALIAASLALVLTGSAAAQQIAPWDQPSLTTSPAALYSTTGGDQRTGSLTYAGGLYMTSGSPRFGGISGLEAEALENGDVLFSAVSDTGDFFQFTGQLDDRQRLVGASDMKIAPLRDERGLPLQRKIDQDAEDISALTDRPGFLVAFERVHRIIAYADPLNPKGGQARVDIPGRVKYRRDNNGIEAVAALPGGVVAIGVEDGHIWLCPKNNQTCTLITDGKPMSVGPSYSLSGLDHLSNGEMIAVYRTRAPLAHWNAKIVHIKVVEGKARFTVLSDMRAFLGNMEGIAAVPLPQGRGWRIFLISDNAFEPREPTLLMAFDWTP